MTEKGEIKNRKEDRRKERGNGRFKKEVSVMEGFGSRVSIF